MSPYPTHLFLTGGSGFVGSAVLRYVLQNTDWRVTVPATMRHQGSQSRIMPLKEEYGDRLRIVPLDLTMRFSRTDIPGLGPVDYVWNIASESHVDRSLENPVPFIRNNVDLMLNVCEFVREVKPRVFLHMSTDEVFGPLNPGEHPHHEWSAIKPSNPYSASKASQEAIAYSYWRAFGIPLVITNTMNLIGPRQDPEKFVPKVIRAINNGETIPVHASPEGESGSRCWIGVEDFADAWAFLTHKLDNLAQAGDVDLTYYPQMPPAPYRFNVVGQWASNEYVAYTIMDIIGKPAKVEMVNFHTSRPGHDMHYGLDGSALDVFGWRPKRNLDETLISTVHWYQDNPEALEV